MELDSWATRSQWYQPLLTVEEMSSVLGVKPQSVRQYMSSVPGFPQPVTTSPGRSRCVQAEFYDFVASERPHLRHRIPRLYPLARTHLNPARLLGAEARYIERQKVVLHYWQPDDDRGPIVTAYPAFHTPLPFDAQAWAQELSAQCAGVSAVVVPSIWPSIIPDPRHPDSADSDQHLRVAVVQPGRFDAEFDGTVGWLDEFSWSDLANLLHVDVPYWPLGLRDADAMLAWQPEQVFKVAPRILDDAATANIWSALENSCSTSVEANDVLTRTCRHADYQLAADLGLIPGVRRACRPGNEQGLLRAAVPAIPDAEPEHPTAGELAGLLHLPADPLHADSARLAGYTVGLWEPVISGVTDLRRERLGPLGQKWLDRLRPATSIQRDEFGYTMVISPLPEYDQKNATLWFDPLDKDCWVAQTDTRILVTQSPSAPAAQGDVMSVEIGVDVGNAFMADSAGQPWLIPNRTNAEYGIGYNGTAPRNLTRALEELVSDIHSHVSGRTARSVDGREEPAALLDLLVSTTSPLTLSRSELCRLIGSAEGTATKDVPAVETKAAAVRPAQGTNVALPNASPPHVDEAIMFTSDAAGQMVAVDIRQFPEGTPLVRARFHDFDGQVIDHSQWKQLFDDDIHSRRRVGCWQSDDGTVQVSTVWTGVSVEGGNPLIFHTTITGGRFHNATMHYSAATQAHVGHARTVTDMKDNRVPWFLVLR